ncbi:hypothetical protein JCM3766R1_000050 [Sporobolomyces carnicolor]
MLPTLSEYRRMRLAEAEEAVKNRPPGFRGPSPQTLWADMQQLKEELCPVRRMLRGLPPHREEVELIMRNARLRWPEDKEGMLAATESQRAPRSESESSSSRDPNVAIAAPARSAANDKEGTRNFETPSFDRLPLASAGRPTSTEALDPSLFSFDGLNAARKEAKRLSLEVAESPTDPAEFIKSLQQVDASIKERNAETAAARREALKESDFRLTLPFPAVVPLHPDRQHGDHELLLRNPQLLTSIAASYGRVYIVLAVRRLARCPPGWIPRDPLTRQHVLDFIRGLTISGHAAAVAQGFPAGQTFVLPALQVAALDLHPAQWQATDPAIIPSHFQATVILALAPFFDLVLGYGTTGAGNYFFDPVLMQQLLGSLAQRCPVPPPSNATPPPPPPPQPLLTRSIATAREDAEAKVSNSGRLPLDRRPCASERRDRPKTVVRRLCTFSGADGPVAESERLSPEIAESTPFSRGLIETLQSLLTSPRTARAEVARRTITLEMSDPIERSCSPATAIRVGDLQCGSTSSGIARGGVETVWSEGDE